jgi:DNA-binding MarR family transcriptional regulator
MTDAGRADHDAGAGRRDDIVLPALLRGARACYSHAITEALGAAGFDDVPRNGAFVIGGMVNHGGSLGDVVRGLGVTKQAASQLIDTLVARGYLDRQVNPADRRRMTIHVTERGEAAATAIGRGIALVDAQLAEMLAPAELAGLRSGLLALCHIRERLPARAAYPSDSAAG